MPDGTLSSASSSEAMEALLLGHMARLRAGRAAIAEAAAALKAVKKAVKVDRNAAGQDFLLKVLDAALDAEEVNDRDAEAEAIQRLFVFECLGLPTGRRQGELDFGEDAHEERDLEYWGGRGYNAGLKLMPAKPPEGMPPQFMQHWLMKHAAGSERTKWAAAALTNVEQGSPDPLLA